MINIQNAKTHLSRLIEESVEGEDIVIAKAGKPLVRLIPFREKARVRKLGALSGLVKEAEGCWETDSDLEALFYDSEEPGISRVAEDAP